jgi:hypothetical protein
MADQMGESFSILQARDYLFITFYVKPEKTDRSSVELTLS